MGAPSFDLRLVAPFVAVAEELHFGRAAQRLMIAQSALSRQIVRLEQQLGVPLLIRSTREVALTAAGERFLTGGREILARAAQARAAAVDGDAGEIAVHVGPGLNPRINTVLSAFARAHPGIRLHLRSGPHSESSAAVAAGRVDVGFDTADGAPTGLGYALVDRWALGLACPPDHRLAGQESVTWPDLEGERLILAPAGHSDGYNTFVRERLRTHRVRCEELVGSDGSLLNYGQVAAGQGVFVLVTFVFAMGPPGLRLVPIRPVSWLEHGVVWDRRRAPTSALRLVQWASAEASRTPRDRAAPQAPDL